MNLLTKSVSHVGGFMLSCDDLLTNLQTVCTLLPVHSCNPDDFSSFGELPWVPQELKRMYSASSAMRILHDWHLDAQNQPSTDCDPVLRVAVGELP